MSDPEVTAAENNPAYQIEPMKRVMQYPLIRYMGSKYKLINWIRNELSGINYDTVLDAFSGSGIVSYFFKSLGKQVYTNDFLHFSYILAKAGIENSDHNITSGELEFLLSENNKSGSFIFDTFKDVFYSREELKFLDQVSFNIMELQNEYKQAIALASIIRSCAKKQPRGVFTISGDVSRYDDGRRDLRLSLREHFIEQIEVYNGMVFDNGRNNLAFHMDIFDFDQDFYSPDLVYMDPPYVPRSDDNCYIKRYHFLEGLSKYWKDEEILYSTKVKKIKKKYTPFSYRKTSLEAFEKLFQKFSNSIIALSYSSNGFPDLDELVNMMSAYKKNVTVKKKEHRYHFGNHNKVKRSLVDEFLIIGK